MLVKLGRELRRAREEKGASLEAVAGPAKISAAYLHKLERGVVSSPATKKEALSASRSMPAALVGRRRLQR